MDLREFVELALPHQETDQVISAVLSADSLRAARELEVDRTQAVIDRVVQGIVAQRVEDERIREQMPLVSPEVDLGLVGERKYGLRDIDHPEKLRLIHYEFEFVGLEDDGSCVTTWREVDEFEFLEADIEQVRDVVNGFPEQL